MGRHRGTIEGLPAAPRPANVANGGTGGEKLAQGTYAYWSWHRRRHNRGQREANERRLAPLRGGWSRKTSPFQKPLDRETPDGPEVTPLAEARRGVRLDRRTYGVGYTVRQPLTPALVCQCTAPEKGVGLRRTTQDGKKNAQSVAPWDTRGCPAREDKDIIRGGQQRPGRACSRPDLLVHHGGG